MFPTIFNLPSYSLTLVVVFFLGAWLAERDARRRGHNARAVIDACGGVLVASLLGGWALFLILNGFRSKWGTEYLGGIVGGIVGAWTVARLHGEPVLRIGDSLAPSLSIGHAIGRMGCFLAGCCYGIPTGHAWGLRFPPGSHAFAELARQGSIAADADRTPPLHPTQLYEAAGELAIFSLLLFVRRNQSRTGQVWFAYLGAYALLRLGVESFRVDSSPTAYLFCTAFLATTLVWWCGRRSP